LIGLKGKIAAQAALRDTLLAAANAEADGTGGSRQRNLGPIYQRKKAAADQAQQELEALRARNAPGIAAAEQTLAQLRQNARDGIATLDRSTRPNGLAARLEHSTA
jgi:hypothetical protein